MEAVELTQQRWVQDVPHRHPAPLLWTGPLPIHEVLQAPHPKSRVQAGPYSVRQTPLDVQGGRRDLPYLNVL